MLGYLHKKAEVQRFRLVALEERALAAEKLGTAVEALGIAAAVVYEA